MDILMYGWEFPPIQSGGLGVACKGIVDGLLAQSHRVHLVLPKTSPVMAQNMAGDLNILSARESGEKVTVRKFATSLSSPYNTSGVHYAESFKKRSAQEPHALYGHDIMEEVHRYAAHAATHAKKVPHDVIHTHDWLTVEAGIQAQRFSQKPHVMHVHATEIDRSGQAANQDVFNLEQRGMHKADRVIAVSHYTKKMLVKHYGVPEWKIDVVHNAVHFDEEKYRKEHHLERQDKIVLFLGRMTMQKGPDYFLKMAAKVLKHKDKVKFIMAGDGDMMQQVIQMALELGIERQVLFAGFLKGKEIARAYGEADLYVMPSVSEPFGIAPLEAIRHGAPVLISKQAGVNEVIKNALRVDFWDVDEMASKVIAALSYPALTQTLREHSTHELNRLSWHGQAERIVEAYSRVL